MGPVDVPSSEKKQTIRINWKKKEQEKERIQFAKFRTDRKHQQKATTHKKLITNFTLWDKQANKR